MRRLGERWKWRMTWGGIWDRGGVGYRIHSAVLVVGIAGWWWW